MRYGQNLISIKSLYIPLKLLFLEYGRWGDISLWRLKCFLDLNFLFSEGGRPIARQVEAHAGPADDLWSSSEEHAIHSDRLDGDRLVPRRITDCL